MLIAIALASDDYTRVSEIVSIVTGGADGNSFSSYANASRRSTVGLRRPVRARAERGRRLVRARFLRVLVFTDRSGVAKTL